MNREKRERGVLTVEATIAYTIFMMVILTILFIIRIVYTYALIQHAVSQTAKELSMYTYVYQVSGAGGMVEGIQDAVEPGETRFNEDAGHIVKIYETLSDGWDSKDLDTVLEEGENMTKDPQKILQEVVSAAAGNAERDVVNGGFSLIARQMVAGYLSAGWEEGADSRLEKLQVTGGLKGLDFSGSSFFEDGHTIDIVVCYNLDPILPIDLMPEMNLMNRATVRGMSGSSIFE